MSVAIDKLKNACSKGLEYIMKNTNTNNLWSDFITQAGESEDWVSGYIGWNIIDLQMDEGYNRVLNQVYKKIILHQRLDGGWGYNRGVPPDADSTAHCIIFLESLLKKQNTLFVSQNEMTNIINNGIEFLIKHQTSEGGFCTYRNPNPIRRYMTVSSNISYVGWCSPQLCVTPIALDAIIKFNKTKYSNNIEKTYKFIKEKQKQDGSWNAYWWSEDIYAVYHCARLLSYKRGENYQHIKKACDWVVQHQNIDGSWSNCSTHTGCPFYTSLAIGTLLLSHSDFENNIQRGIEYLLNSQKNDGSWIGLPKLRIPYTNDTDPAHSGYSAIRDHNSLFTTATVIHIINGFLKISNLLKECKIYP